MARYAVVRDSDGLIENVVLWDGESEWSPPADTSAVDDASDEAGIYGWDGDSVFHGPTPAIDSILPVSGGTAGGTTVTIQGYNLEGDDVVVKFDGEAATNLANQTKTSLDCDTPAHAVGDVDVTVENDVGTWTGRSTLSSSFEYTA